MSTEAGRSDETSDEMDDDRSQRPFTRTDVPEAPDDPADPPVQDGPLNSA